MAGVIVLRYLSIPNIHPMLLSSQLRYALYGTVLSASLISLSSWAFAAAADGVFGDYFRNIINTPCTYWYEVITGFDVSAGTSYGTKTCTNIATVLGNISNAVNVGIGTLSPVAKLDVAGSIIGNYLTIRPQNTTFEWGEIKLEKGPSNTKDAYIDNAADRLRIHNGSAEILSADLINGNIGIGTTTPWSKLEIASSIDNILRLNRTTGNSWNYMEWMIAGARKYWTGIDNNGVFNIQWDSSAAVAINAVGGNVGIWTTTPTEKLHVIGNIKVSNNIEANQYYYTSDRRLKEDISPLKNSLDKILSLNGYTYRWKSTGHKDIWVIAQEVETVFPELVKTNPDTGFKSVEYGNLVAPLIEAIKEQQAEIDTLRTELAEIKSQLK